MNASAWLYSLVVGCYQDCDLLSQTRKTQVYNLFCHITFTKTPKTTNIFKDQFNLPNFLTLSKNVFDIDAEQQNNLIWCRWCTHVDGVIGHCWEIVTRQIVAEVRTPPHHFAYLINIFCPQLNLSYLIVSCCQSTIYARRHAVSYEIFSNKNHPNNFPRSRCWEEKVHGEGGTGKYLFKILVWQ